MGLDQHVVDEIVALIRTRFPDWQDVADAGFTKEERDYKRRTVEKAIGLDGLLTKEALQVDLEGGAYQSFITRFRTIGTDSHLFFDSVPGKSELLILTGPPSDQQALCTQLFDLVWGPDDSTSRLGRWIAYVHREGLQQNWPFPTCYLWICHPDEEMFIRPQPLGLLAKHLGLPWSFSGGLSATTYAAVRDWSLELQNAMTSHGAKDLVDVQSVMWVAGNALKRGTAASTLTDAAPAAIPRYWKIAPGAHAWNWDACREGGFISIGWEELGDIGAMSEEDFDARMAEEIARHTDWGKGAKQVWRFANEIAVGDILVANRGMSEVIGFGRVTGPYEFEPGLEHGHHRAVDWFDTRVRHLPDREGGWRSTLLPLSEEKYAALLTLPHGSNASGLGAPFSRLFAERAEAEAAFDLMSDALKALGVTSNDDERFAVTYSANSRRLTLDYGPWCVMRCWPVEKGRRLQLAVPENDAPTSHLPIDFRFKEATPDNPIVLRSLEPAALTPEIRSVFLKTALGIRELFGHRRSSNWRSYHINELGAALLDPAKRDTLLTDGLMPAIRAYMEGDAEETEVNPPYSLDDLAAETSLPKKNLEAWLRAIDRKGQAILYGPPGTGKTYVAERLAKHLVAGGTGTAELVQFHPAYAYEDFMQGMRPKARDGGGLDYPIMDGRFKQFCDQARGRDGLSVLIIDEVNRANLARVFGELMYLLEYRDKSIPLAAGGRFSIPANVRLIGTMNTADRSIALVDHALRRRFAFLPLYPDYQMLADYHAKNGGGYDPAKLVEVLKDLNRKIGDHHYEVGTSFFMRPDIAEQLPDVWSMEIEPYLEEYFFDQRATVDSFRWGEVKKKLGME